MQFFNNPVLRKSWDSLKKWVNTYRFGFQGQEKDDEIKGSGNSINYKYRMHDPRIGRFFAVDPLTKKYPMYSPYHFSSNQPIHANELEGLESSDDLNFESFIHYEITSEFLNAVSSIFDIVDELFFASQTTIVETTFFTRPFRRCKKSLINQGGQYHRIYYL
ncbi:MAG: hypothetical protein K9H64_21805 [Bacteroidales bacterium]|nr:hypothetical protein [Bacteroidales bacterium]MCF8458664.1 hypothetical protein [Bacteroidales bacterium]